MFHRKFDGISYEITKARGKQFHVSRVSFSICISGTSHDSPFLFAPILLPAMFYLAALFFFLDIDLPLHCLLWFHINFRITFSISVKNASGILIVH